MKELMQRLSGVDADASAAVNVIAYFDTLLARGAGIAAFVRGAAVLAGCPAGLEHPRHRIWIRADSSGETTRQPHSIDAIDRWPHQDLDDGSGGVVWIERNDAPQSSDAVLLERFAAGVHITLERISPVGLGDDAAATEILLVPTSTAEMRRKAAARLGIRDDAVVRVVASDTDSHALGLRRSAIVNTSVGSVCATLLIDGDPFPPGFLGIAPEAPISEVPEAWLRALTALRLTSDAVPAVRWINLGAMSLLAEMYDGDPPFHPDLDSVEQVAQRPWGLATLDALSQQDSLRGAASQLGIHHSTLQRRKELAEKLLGFDVGLPSGRTRLVLAVSLHRLHYRTFSAGRVQPSEVDSATVRPAP